MTSSSHVQARRIGVVTVGRSDYGCYLPVLQRIVSEPTLALHLVVAGMHLAPEFGLTVRMIEADGWPIGDRIEMLVSSDTPEGIATSMGLGTTGFARSFARVRPDILLLLGDRFEMHAAAVAALPFAIPVAHIHGGELTLGAFDDALRHSITKLSHLHFAATHEYARRIEQMGEEPWRITVSGAPALDRFTTLERLSREALAELCGVSLERDPLLVTYHPVTLEYEQTAWQVRELLEALRSTQGPIVLTLPNADTHGRLIRQLIEAFVAECPRARLVSNLGTRAYASLMAISAAMVGNSSSGLIEAPSFGLPVVNIGTRQQGRLRAANVIDVGYSRDDIAQGIRQALQPDFRAGLRGLRNPYGDGHAAERIVQRLAEIALDDRLLKKRFADSAAPRVAGMTQEQAALRD